MKTKIIATLGPASSSKEKLRELIQAGVSVFRLNFSHGTHADHLKVIANIRSVNQELGTHAAILGDLQGPKIRIGNTQPEGMMLVDGQTVHFTGEECVCTPEHICLTYDEFFNDVKVGDNLQLDDGKISLKVVEVDAHNKKAAAIVLHGGPLSSHKGVNLPDTEVSIPSLTDKDLDDLRFILENNLNWVALSFVRKGSDIVSLRNAMQSMAITDQLPAIIAKMEKPEAVRNMHDIIRESDALMVARGDLGVELPLEQVPMVQKKLVAACIQASKQIIVATQMMEGMINNIRPTRAEVNDVANSVLDGADAVMLSGETSVGSFPVEVVQTMARIIAEVESYEGMYFRFHTPDISNRNHVISDTILHAACTLAHDSNAKAIVALSRTGYSAAQISSRRPRQDVHIISDNQFLVEKLSLLWGVESHYFDKIVHSTSKTLRAINEQLVKEGKLKSGDLVLHVTSTPIYHAGKTNSIKLEYIS